MSESGASPSPVRTPQQKRTLFWTRLAALAFLIAVAVVKPKFDAWLAGNAGETPTSEVAASDTVRSSDEDLSADEDLSILAGITVADSVGDANSDSDLIFDYDNDSQRGSTKSSENDGASHTKAKSKTQQSGSSSTSPKSGSTSNPGTSSGASGNDPRRNPSKNGASAKKASDDQKDPPGKLSLLAGTRDRFRSTAGLMYLPGSREGHRLKHVLKHAKDDPSKPVHGVFSGDRDQILAWIDIAYEKGRKGGKGVNRSEENDRVVYVVDMGKKIGYVGGQVGKRKNRPPCKYLQLVLEDGNEVITAYPSDRAR